MTVIKEGLRFASVIYTAMLKKRAICAHKLYTYIRPFFLAQQYKDVAHVAIIQLFLTIDYSYMFVAFYVLQNNLRANYNLCVV